MVARAEPPVVHDEALDADAALRVITEHVAKPLGLSPAEAAIALLAALTIAAAWTST